ncbi:MAG: aspartate--tRNA(Asn) ligase [Clostridia bacterium]|nr:aspartate--tRNA(Asn) ligase [Clostridia bacterium]
MRTYIKDLKTLSGQTAEICGFVEKFRDQKSVQFIIIRDITGAVQVTVDKASQENLLETTSLLTTHSFVRVKGKVIENAYVKLGGIEISPEEFVIESIAENLPIDPDSNIDQKMDYRWVDMRTQKNALMMKVQTKFVEGARKFLLENGFLEMHSPKIISHPSESGSDLFTLDYFGEKAYLTQSPQFYKQMAMASGLDRIFEIGPVFRAEKSFTNRHTTEFTGIDLEISWVESLEDVMQIEENMIAYAFKEVKEAYGEDIQKLFGVELVVPTVPFPRMKMEKAIEILQDLDYDIEFGEDFATEHEKALGEYLVKKNGHEFYFITDFPSDFRAFYQKRYEGTKITQSFDLYFKGMEITTGSLREHRYEQLTKQAIEHGNTQENIQFYLDFFRYGCAPHGGFGIGLDRMTMLMLNLSSIKESMYIFRGPTRFNP